MGALVTPSCRLSNPRRTAAGFDRRLAPHPARKSGACRQAGDGSSARIRRFPSRHPLGAAAGKSHRRANQTMTYATCPCHCTKPGGSRSPLPALQALQLVVHFTFTGESNSQSSNTSVKPISRPGKSKKPTTLARRSCPARSDRHSTAAAVPHPPAGDWCRPRTQGRPPPGKHPGSQPR